MAPLRGWGRTAPNRIGAPWSFDGPDEVELLRLHRTGSWRASRAIAPFLAVPAVTRERRSALWQAPGASQSSSTCRKKRPRGRRKEVATRAPIFSRLENPETVPPARGMLPMKTSRSK
ncbi:MAG: hypothetical protein USCAAHI_00708 [Beijerinckiaceae bacterium]|nr:MAG: hypothetical protein USCAAHI_00708 [Beijerinckiaceae bacterium]